MATEQDDKKDTTTKDAATAAGLTKDEVTSLLTAAMKPITDALASLAGNQKVLADTLAKLPPAPAATDDKSAKKDDAAAAAGAKPITADDVKTLVADVLKQDRTLQEQTAEQRKARDAFVAGETSGLAKLPPEFQARLGSDPGKWPDEAKAITGSWEKFVKDNNIKLPDVGGAGRDGGNAPGGAGNTTENAAKPGSWIKMPA